MVIEQKFLIGFKSVNSDMLIKNSAILTLFEEMACIHTERIGHNFSASDSRWLLIAYKLNILSRPKYGSEVIVTTWSTGYNGIVASREFEIRDKNGNLLISALSNWVSMNLKTMRIDKLTKEQMALYESEPNRTNFNESRLNKLIEPTEHSLSVDMLIDWRWMDMNNHMNNTYYLDIAEHYMPNDWQQNITKNFEIMYKQQIRENDKIKCKYSEIDDAYTVTFKSEDDTILYSIVKYYK